MVGSDEGHYAGDPSKPVVLSDVFARVGGPDEHPVQAATMVVVNAGNVLGDNLWLWRADHTVSGLVYNGVSLFFVVAGSVRSSLQQMRRACNER